VLIDDLLPEYQFSERHSTTVAAAPERVYEITRRLDMSGSSLIRLLFRLRGLPPTALNLDGLCELGFSILAERPGRELVLGLVGRFWTRAGGLLPVGALGFGEFKQPGYAMAAWNFQVSALPQGGTSLSTETRVLCTDAASRFSFQLYWLLVRPFSGLIRRVMLREVKREAESGMSRPTSR
jgi:hypothetical protein